MSKSIWLVSLLVLTAGCASGIPQSEETKLPNEGCDIQNNKQLVDNYPASVSSPLAVVVPDEYGVAINRSITVLKHSYADHTEQYPAVVSSSELTIGEGRSLVVLAPQGNLPSEIGRHVDINNSASTTTSAQITVVDNPSSDEGHLIVISGGKWGIRAAADALANRGGQRVEDCGTVTANVSEYSGTVQWQTDGTKFLRLVTSNASYVIPRAAAPEGFQERASNTSFNVTVRAYQTEMRAVVWAGSEGQVAYPRAVEIVAVSDIEEAETARVDNNR
ncbi:hypothetical protein [Halobellus ruber]|uniref:Uncharacterized protein n=1 Tax=Halobellus ruber TaxID=2761102 RepID=A0A7J9SLE5_9EURY|nr:hypothetical protein [Halobellus ruber]MBB6647342.1 hypothetical protein [Halobellus ruber]